jgi:class 3 adenylate cyclase
VTFLFTDIEGSTRLWESAPASMQEALEAHDRIVRDAVDACGGYVFATGGDGFAAAFARAGDAVKTAIDAQRALEARLGVERYAELFAPGALTEEADLVDLVRAAVAELQAHAPPPP